MKKLTLFFILLSSAVFAQEAKYKHVVVVDEKDFQVITQSLNAWRLLCIYDGALNSDQKVQLSKDLDTYILKMMQTVKLDSVMVSPAQRDEPKNKKTP